MKLSILILLIGFTIPVYTQEMDVSARLGLGTDITGGLAFGGQLNSNSFVTAYPVELGIMFYGGLFSETSDNGFNVYVETTELYILVSVTNYLFNYTGKSGNIYFLTGTGFGIVYLYWMEESETDTSLGTLLPGGGSMQDFETVSAVNVSNIGIGYVVNESIDLRFEIPCIIFFEAYGSGKIFVPTFVLSAGYRF